MLDLGTAGTHVEAATIAADDVDRWWYVAEGHADVFMAVKGDEGDEEGRWRPLSSAGAGTLIPGLEPDRFTTVIRPAPGAKVERIDRGELRRIAEADPAAAAEVLLPRSRPKRRWSSAGRALLHVGLVLLHQVRFLDIERQGIAGDAADLFGQHVAVGGEEAVGIDSDEALL